MRKHRWLATFSLVVMAGVLLLSGRGGASQATPRLAPAVVVTLHPVADATIDQALPNTNFGGSTQLWVAEDEFTQVRRSLLRFDLSSIPAGATINSAYLRLYLRQAFSTPSINITAHRNTNAWTEAGVTWNTRPNAICCFGSANVGSTTGVRYSWDVTMLARGWRQGIYANNGLTLVAPAAYFDRMFDSREATFRPELVVDYSLPTNTPTPTPTGIFILSPTPTHTRTPTPVPLGSISGYVWRDANRNGSRDLDEPGLAGVRVDVIADGVVTHTAHSDASGAYSFTGLPSDSYLLAVDDSTLPGSYQLVSGADPRLVFLAPGAHLSNIDFGYDLPATDLIALRLEVTQAVQDLNNMVRLVAGKRTFVRFHVRSSSGVHRTWATLIAQRGGRQVLLFPINDAADINVQVTPNRGILDHAFLFEVPTEFTQGTVSLTAELNPILSPFRPHRNPLELTYHNNSAAAAVTFERAPALSMVVYRVGYRQRTTGVTHWPDPFHTRMLQDWLRRAYPAPDVWMVVRDTFWGSVGLDDRGRLTDISCGGVNSRIDGLTTTSPPIVLAGSVVRSYGMVDNGGGFMRGCSGVPSRASSGPTGSGSFGWDFDGSFGDWYGAHETAHSLNQQHIRGGPSAGDGGCGDEDGGRNLYAIGAFRGIISPAATGDTALFGFDSGNQVIGAGPTIYGPFSHDVMTYCDNQWVSDITFHGLMDYLRSIGGAAVAAAPGAVADRLLVIGVIDPDSGTLELDPLFVFPDAEDVKPPVPGDYAIVLRAANGQELARYAFTPEEVHPGPPAPGELEPHFEFLNIFEFVPFVSGASRVDIEGPAGMALVKVLAGPAAPVIQVTAPAQGAVLTGPAAQVAWMGSDADGDPLSYLVQYSYNNGATWENVSFPISGTTTEIPLHNLVSSQAGRFRVLASDGVHTTAALSPPFVVPNHLPQVEILSPASGVQVASGQTVHFSAFAYDPDLGAMTGEALTWTSSLDGFLGDGSQLSLAELGPGQHVVTFQADDGAGGVATDQVLVIVHEDPGKLPAPPHALSVGPSPILLGSAVGLWESEVYVDNPGGTSLDWQAATDAPWLELQTKSGKTPGSLLVRLSKGEAFGSTRVASNGVSVPNASPLPGPGWHEGVITFTSPDLPGHSAAVVVRVIVLRFDLFLPTLLR